MAIETTLIGSYPKIGDSKEEQKLRRALHQCDKGEISEEQLEQVKNEVTEEAIRFQSEAGIDIVTDGLIRRDDALTYIARKVVGFNVSGLIRYFDTNTFYRQPIVESRLEWVKPITVDDYKFAVAHSLKPVKAVLTGPFTMAKLSLNQFYREEKQLVFDLAHILHREAQALEEAGCKYIQFDEPALLQYPEELKCFFKAHEVLLAQLGDAEKTVSFNFGSVGEVYPKILELPAHRIGLDLTEGHANWEVLKKSKFSKKLMAGVIDSRNTKMESESAVVDLVGRLSEHADMDQLWLTHNHRLEFLPLDEAKRKIELLTKVAGQLKGAGVS